MPTKYGYEPNSIGWVMMTPLDENMQPLNDQAIMISAEDIMTIPDISFLDDGPTSR